MAVRGRGLLVLGFALISLISAGIASAQPVFPPFDPAACTGKPQHLLIFDMKSGWWSNDGADFHNLLLPRIVKDCPSIDIEYYFLQHLDGLDGVPLPPGLPALQDGIMGLLSYYPLRPGIQNDSLFNPGNFPTRPIGEYSQLWLLSGSDLDPTDVPTTHTFFGTMVTRITTIAATPTQPLPGLFVGTGIGNRDHANSLLTALQLPALFQSHLSENDTPGVGDGTGIEVLTRGRANAELTAHSLFEGVDNIADQVGINGQPFDTDFLLTANNPFQILGRNTNGEPAIAVRDLPERRFVIDAGMQRYYSLFKPEEAGTYRYIQNIIKYLAR